MKAINRVCVIGLGYIGLPTAVVLASRGIEVHGVDTNPQIVETINGGRPHFTEPSLSALVSQVVSSGYLRAHLEPGPADAFVIAVPTPAESAPDGGRRPVSLHVEQAARAVAPRLEPDNLVVLESTSPVGTTEQLSQWLAEERPDLSFPHQKGELSDIRIAHCPERVLPGRILEEVVNNDRVIGGMTRKCAQQAMSFYGVFAHGAIEVTDARTAELTKLVENAFRDVNIAFANELAGICDKLGVDVWHLIRMANLHPRVSILRPGPGVGGHCIAVDPWFIIDGAGELARMIRLAREINEARPAQVVADIRREAAAFERPRIACLGLTYKRDVSDMRESPALEVVKRLVAEDFADILVVEPYLSGLPAELSDTEVELADFGTAVATADVVVLLVDHQAFHEVRMGDLSGKIVIDTRGVWLT